MATTYPEHLREEVERYLQTLRFSGETLTAGLEEAMRYSLLAGGKRIRPVLALATARAVGAPHDQVLPLAAAIELLLDRGLRSMSMDDVAARAGVVDAKTHAGHHGFAVTHVLSHPQT